jgi:dimethylamine/trimethylamine dehydrogenase
VADPFAILFEPVPIGPVTAPNRFYQVPHCNGLGYRMPRALAAMRGMKAEGGWGVVCTEEVEIHYTSDLMPYVEGRLWSDDDLPAHQLVVEAIHQHGALAGIELTHSGHHATNLASRVPPPGLRSRGLGDFTPGQSRPLDKADIREIRRWHRAAALRAKQAGYDIVYCYAAHELSLAMHFLLRRYNDRTDEYGGSLANRVRFLRELLEDTHEAVGDRCAVALRLAVDELLGDDGLTAQGEGYDIVALLAELPDLWDVNISDWDNDSATSRFEKEGYQEPYIAFVKGLTSKPVVGVGRYTSPDSMVRAVRQGIVDFIGAARPSIADPFLPNKIRDGRFEDIRECIGCNICVTGDTLATPIRCTQNPTMGEEWRREWHPEQISVLRRPREVLVVGAGPAGLECARALGQRRCQVTLVEAASEPGGRLRWEAALPGLSEWRRVVDWRLAQIARMPQVTLYPGSPMTHHDVLDSGLRHVIVATGSTWRRDGIGRHHWQPIPGHDLPHVHTPDDMANGRWPADAVPGRVVIYDDDHYYLGGVLAERLALQGWAVELVTPAPLVSYWSQYTLEQARIEARLAGLGVRFHVRHALAAIRPDHVLLEDVITGVKPERPAAAVLLLTDRLPNNELYLRLKPALAKGKKRSAGRHLASLRVVGDAEAPNIIAQAIFSGHLAAREFGAQPPAGVPYKIEHVAL